MHANQDFVLLRNRLFDLPDFEHLGWTVSVANQRFHILANSAPWVWIFRIAAPM